jgi:phasin
LFPASNVNIKSKGITMATAPKKNAAAQAASARPQPVREIAAIPEQVKAAVAEPAAEIRQSLRAAVEKSVVDSRTAFAKAKASADEAASAIEVSFAAAKDGALAINTKAFEALRVNAEANFDYLKASLAVKSLSDLVALQSEFARKQMDAMTAQAKDIGALAQKTMVDVAEPLKEQVAKSFKVAV